MKEKIRNLTLGFLSEISVFDPTIVWLKILVKDIYFFVSFLRILEIIRSEIDGLSCS